MWVLFCEGKWLTFLELRLNVEAGSLGVCSADIAAFWRSRFLALESFKTELPDSTFRFAKACTGLIAPGALRASTGDKSTDGYGTC
jgi:hypothetical protein